MHVFMVCHKSRIATLNIYLVWIKITSSNTTDKLLHHYVNFDNYTSIELYLYLYKVQKNCIECIILSQL